MNSMILVSALYGDYDEPPALPHDLGIKSVMYTDNPHLYAQGWEEIRVVPHGIVSAHGDPRITGPMLAHKYWKMFGGWDEADITIWLDASMTIAVDDFVTRCADIINTPAWDLVLMQHPWRNNVHDEALYSAELPRYASLANDLHDQLWFYANLGLEYNTGLFASGFYIRRNIGRVHKLMKDWWWECITRTHQDQVSLPVVLALNPDVDFFVGLPWHDDPGCWTHLGHHLK